ILKNLVIRPRTHEEVTPAWEGYPLLEDMTLELGVNSTGPIFVDNDLARQLKLEANLQVGGTLSSPAVGGEIRVVEGAFRIAFLRGDDFLALPGGSISFYPGRSMPDETPELNVRAEKTFTDANDQEHLVTLVLQGPLGQFRLELETSSGLNTGQTAVLLATG